MKQRKIKWRKASPVDAGEPQVEPPVVAAFWPWTHHQLIWVRDHYLPSGTGVPDKSPQLGLVRLYLVFRHQYKTFNCLRCHDLRFKTFLTPAAADKLRASRGPDRPLTRSLYDPTQKRPTLRNSPGRSRWWWWSSSPSICTETCTNADGECIKAEQVSDRRFISGTGQQTLPPSGRYVSPHLHAYTFTLFSCWIFSTSASHWSLIYITFNAQQVYYKFQLFHIIN